MKVLLTGGLGYIGSHICLELLSNNYEVVIIDSLVNSNLSVLERIKKIMSTDNVYFKDKISFYKDDLRNEKKLRNLFEINLHTKTPIGAVIHCAGLKSVADSIKRPLDYWLNNVNSTLVLMKIMEEFKCKTIIFSSSATIYGVDKQELIDENVLINPINPYGQTKACIEKFLSDIYSSNPHDWRIANLRYFNPVGAHSSGLIGESPKGIANNIFPVIQKVAAGQIDKLKIFGDNWDTYDGTGVRDYIHVMDLADGHVKCLKYIENKKNQFLNVNLGTGIGTSVLELVKTYEIVNNVKITYEIVSRRKGDFGCVVADNSKAISTLGWTPTRSIEEMCKDSWKFQINN
tara:strand:- start:4488 stop:5525 length:1038 start_codon:yes stop_codon:yes gene_type:complete